MSATGDAAPDWLVWLLLGIGPETLGLWLRPRGAHVALRYPDVPDGVVVRDDPLVVRFDGLLATVGPDGLMLSEEPGARARLDDVAAALVADELDALDVPREAILAEVSDTGRCRVDIGASGHGDPATIAAAVDALLGERGLIPDVTVR